MPGLNLSTELLGKSDLIEAWRHAFGHAICQLEIEPLADRPFRSRAQLRLLPGLGMVSGSCTGARYLRRPAQAESDDLIFVLNLLGTDLAHARGREVMLGPGDAVLMRAGEIGGVSNRADAAFATFRLPASSIVPMVKSVDDLILRRIPAETEALSLCATTRARSMRSARLPLPRCNARRRATSMT